MEVRMSECIAGHRFRRAALLQLAGEALRRTDARGETRAAVRDLERAAVVELTTAVPGPATVG
jgi:hypothetical protein